MTHTNGDTATTDELVISLTAEEADFIATAMIESGFSPVALGLCEKLINAISEQKL